MTENRHSRLDGRLSRVEWSSFPSGLGIYHRKSAKFFKKVLHFYFLSLYLQSQIKGNDNRGVAQLASASGLGPEGPVFESQYPDKAEAEMLPLFLQDAVRSKRLQVAVAT